MKLSAQAKATMALVKAISISIMVDQDRDGNPHASEILKNDPNQMSAFDEEPVTNVLKLKSVQ
ncbi:conserved hypothetical protein [Candidatus Desulfosporosinus infrequens]|uniref:Uncharacterized protein n=1 Tax=Candidatus Desulfosporosinus infrequens TaxID=2043169 RepID=A0A2U3LI89_9FIRM|nr:conserved hypothetical protein [Candidatus Desulfosporosinus infrequens]